MYDTIKKIHIHTYELKYLKQNIGMPVIIPARNVDEEKWTETSKNSKTAYRSLVVFPFIVNVRRNKNSVDGSECYTLRKPPICRTMGKETFIHFLSV